MKPEQMNTIINQLKDSRYRDYNTANIDEICEFVFIKFFLPLLDYNTISVQYENNTEFVNVDDLNIDPTRGGIKYRTWLPFSLFTARLKKTYDGLLEREGALAMNIINLTRIEGCSRKRVFDEICDQLRLYFHSVCRCNDNWDNMLHVIRWCAYAGGFDLLKFLDILVQDEEVAGSIVVSIEHMIHEFMPGQSTEEKFAL